MTNTWFHKPIFVVCNNLELDRRGNKLIEVFVKHNIIKKGKRAAEITCVFGDEDIPEFVANAIYDKSREEEYGRSEDIETFYYLYDTMSIDSRFTTKDPSKIYFELTQSDSCSCSCTKLHNTKSIKWDKFEKNGKQPIIYVVTWNHMFNYKCNDIIKVSEKMYGDYKLSDGDRGDAEFAYMNKK